MGQRRQNHSLRGFRHRTYSFQLAPAALALMAEDHDDEREQRERGYLYLVVR